MAFQHLKKSYRKVGKGYLLFTNKTVIYDLLFVVIYVTQIVICVIGQGVIDIKKKFFTTRAVRH